MKLMTIFIDGEEVCIVPAMDADSMIDELSFDFDFADETWTEDGIYLTTESE